MKSENIKHLGFTLIELLVVVLIIGILAAVAVPQYQKAVVKARLANVKTVVAAIKTADEAYYMANGSYTGTLADLDLDLEISNCTLVQDDTVCVYDKYWVIDNLQNDTPNIRVGYCPGYQSRWDSSDGCRDNSDFIYTIWLDNSSYPGKIECNGSTDLGRAVCASF